MKSKKIFFVIFTLSLLFSCGPTDNPQQKQLTVSKAPDKVEYNVGDNFSTSGMTVKDLNGNIVEDWETSIADGTILEEVGDFTVIVSKQGYKSTNFHIVVDNFKSLFINTLPDKLMFEEGDLYSLTGLTLIDEERNDVPLNLCNFTYKPGHYVPSQGVYTNYITREGYRSTSFEFSVSIKNDELSIYHAPNKTSYIKGEYFSTDGLVIHDKLGNLVTDYTIVPANGSQLKSVGTITVTISKTGFKSTSFTISVTDSQQEKTDKTLKFYYMNDTHGSFAHLPDYKEPGMALVSTYLKEQKAKDPNNTFILSGGDMMQGGYESNQTYGQIMIDSMKEIGFDAMACGNHEFDWGEERLEIMASQLETAGIPLLNCNVTYSKSGKVPYEKPSYFKDYCIIERNDVKVGIIGSIQSGIGSSIDAKVSNNFTYSNPVNYIKTISDELRLNYSCDVVVLLAHDEGPDSDSGQSEPTKFYDLTQTSSASNCKYVDAMFFGHDHAVKNGVYNGVPFIEAGQNGQNVGLLELNLEGNSTGYTVTSGTSTNTAIYNVVKTKNPDPAIISLTQNKYASVLTEAETVLHTFTRYYSKNDFTKVIAEAMVWFVNKYSDEYFDGEYVYMGVHNTGGTREAVYAGDFTNRILVKICPFDNPLCITQSTSAQYNYMETSSYYRVYKNGDPVYDDTYHTQCVTISYISDSKYGKYCQDSYKEYPQSAKLALKEFLVNGMK